MSEGNGYASLEDVFAQPFCREYKDVVVGGLKFRLRSWNSLELARWRTANGDDPESSNERVIIGSCVTTNGELLFNQDHVKRLQIEKGAGFIAALAAECSLHAGSDIETKKNSTVIP